MEEAEMSDAREFTRSDQSELIGVEGIWADVNIRVVIYPHSSKKDHITGDITITAVNHTNKAVKLEQAYELPIRRVSLASANIPDAETLRAVPKRNKLCVFFDDKPRTLGPGEKFTWRIAYERTTEVYLERILAYDLFIDPQLTFQGVPVRKHHFTLSVTLRTPDDAKWRKLSHWRLHQQNSLDINPKVSRSADDTAYTYAFDLIDEPFDVRIASVYELRSVVTKALHFIVAAAIIVFIEHGLATMLVKVGSWLGLGK
jgi:hypothetical protein